MNISSVSQNHVPNFKAFSIDGRSAKKLGKFVGVGKFLYDESYNMQKAYSKVNGYDNFDMMRNVILPAISRQKNAKLDILLTDVVSNSNKGQTDVYLLLKDKMGKVLNSVKLNHDIHVVKDSAGHSVVETQFTKALRMLEGLANK